MRCPVLIEIRLSRLDDMKQLLQSRAILECCSALSFVYKRTNNTDVVRGGKKRDCS
jgi:hypothetical protein